MGKPSPLKAAAGRGSKDAAGEPRCWSQIFFEESVRAPRSARIAHLFAPLRPCTDGPPRRAFLLDEPVRVLADKGLKSPSQRPRCQPRASAVPERRPRRAARAERVTRADSKSNTDSGTDDE